jgi:hypothetical protein
MPLQVERDNFDLQEGFHYYLSFKPNTLVEDIEAHSRIPVEVALSVSETGDLADVSFELPKPCRNDQALAFLRQQDEVKYVQPRVFVALPGLSGDTVVRGVGQLEMDVAGRIIGMEIRWVPTRGAMA